MSAKIDAESREILRYISEDFVQYVGGKQEVALHVASGDMITKAGLANYCAKHYGDLLFVDSEGKEERVSAGATWWTWNDPEKRVVRRIVMEPTQLSEADDNPEVFNLWHMRKKEMAEPDMTASLESVEILVNHLMYISDGDQQGVLYFLNWLAQLYQAPGIKIPTAILMYSEFGGVGKSSLHKLISRVFGQSMTGSCTGHQIQKQFNDVVEYKRLVFVNEMPKSEKADHYEQFKNAVSEEFVQFEGKGRASKEIRNIAHYIITTNHTKALPLMKGDRRICVLKCTAQRKDDAYYTRLINWMENEGPGLLAGVLAQWVFPAGWDPYAPAPQTDAAKFMQEEAQSSLDSLLVEMIEEGMAPFDLDGGKPMDLLVQLQTLHGATLLKGVPLNHRTLPATLKRIGAQFRLVHLPLPNGGQTTARIYVWRNWEEKWINWNPVELHNYVTRQN